MLARQENHPATGRAATGEAVDPVYAPADDYDEILAFLSQPGSYPEAPDTVDVLETHMSMVFLAGDRVYKLKRPIRLSCLDNRTLDARRAACEAELDVNQALAADVYLGTMPVVRRADGQLALGDGGDVREWLVVMRRLDESAALGHMVEAGSLQPAHVHRLCDRLAQFYRGQPALEVSADAMIELWRERVECTAASLTDPLFDLPADLVDPLLAALRRFLLRDEALIRTRVQQGRIVDGHGDLKPEHIYFGQAVLIIDRLEFDPRLRWCDPFDEISFLGMECSRLGDPDILTCLVDGMARQLGNRPPDALLQFYRCHHACLRARLSIEHLRDETPRTPERWPRQARAYLRLAAEVLPLPDQS